MAKREREPITEVWEEPQRRSRGRSSGGRSGGQCSLKPTRFLCLNQ